MSDKTDKYLLQSWYEEANRSGERLLDFQNALDDITEIQNAENCETSHAIFLAREGLLKSINIEIETLYKLAGEIE